MLAISFSSVTSLGTKAVLSKKLRAWVQKHVICWTCQWHVYLNVKEFDGCKSYDTFLSNLVP